MVIGKTIRTIQIMSDARVESISLQKPAFELDIMICLYCIIDSDFGNTPAHYAAEGGKAECFNCCLQHEADLKVINIKRDTPLDTAKKNGHPLLMEKAG